MYLRATSEVLRQFQIKRRFKSVRESSFERAQVDIGGLITLCKDELESAERNKLAQWKETMQS